MRFIDDLVDITIQSLEHELTETRDRLLEETRRAESATKSAREAWEFAV